MSEFPSLLSRLDAIRSSARRRMIALGICSVTGGGVLVFFAALGLDWLVRFPPLFRVVGVCAYALGILLATWHGIVKALLTPLSRERVAALVEHRLGGLHDRLITSVELVQMPVEACTPLARRVVADTERFAREWPLESVLRARALSVQAALALFCVIVVAGFVLAVPDWAGIGVQRYVNPFGQAQWPTRVLLTPLTANITVPPGGTASLRVRIDRGLSARLRPLAVTRGGADKPITAVMNAVDSNVYEAVVEGIAGDVVYWFEAGDATTAHQPGRIQVVRRPEVEQAVAVVEPPEYAQPRVSRTFDLTEGCVRAWIGGAVTIRVRTNKPLVPEDSDFAPAVLERDNATRVPLLPDGDDGRAFLTRLEVARSLKFQIRLRDETGLTNSQEFLLCIEALRDTPPDVSLIEPSGVTELTSVGFLSVAARARDDWGVRRMELLTGRPDDASIPTVAEEMELNVFARPVGPRMESSVPDALSSEWMGTLTWEASRHALRPGDVAALRATAHDNVPGDAEGRRGASSEVLVRIISEAEFASRVAQELRRIEDGIREAAVEQADLLARTEELNRLIETASISAEERQRRLEPILRRQLHQRRVLERQSHLAGALATRMTRNRFSEESEILRVENLSEHLKHLALKRTSDILHTLDDARHEPQVERQKELFAEAQALQRDVLERLRDLLDGLAQWGTFQALAGSMRSLLDRQHAVRQATFEAAQRAADHAEQMESSAAPQALDRLEYQQARLRADVDIMLQRMQSYAAEDGTDALTREALEDAIRAARSYRLSHRLEEAEKGLRENRAWTAYMEQKAAEEGFEAMLRAFEQRDRRRLDLLRKALSDAREQVRRLIEEQQAVRSATQEQGRERRDEAFDPLEFEQRRIRRNTAALAEELRQVDRSTRAAQPVQESARFMTQSEELLRERRPAQALAPQDEAIVRLEEAAAILDRLSSQASERAFRKTLAQIRNLLQTLLEAQQLLHEELAELAATMTPGMRVSRVQARRCARLARGQHDVIVMAEGALEELDEIQVYRWSLTRVRQWMESVRIALNQRTVPADVVATSRRVLDELSRLIRAIVELQALPLNTQFVESGGGGGDGSAQGAPVVPPLAELLVLKAMQLDINKRTAALAETIDSPAPSEAQLREMVTLAEDQKGLLHLTDQLVNQAREQQSPPP